MDKGHVYFTMEQQIETLKLKNEVLYLKLVKLQNSYPQLGIQIDDDQLDFEDVGIKKDWVESLRVYENRAGARSNSPKQKKIISSTLISKNLPNSDQKPRAVKRLKKLGDDSVKDQVYHRAGDKTSELSQILDTSIDNNKSKPIICYFLIL